MAALQFSEIVLELNRYGLALRAKDSAEDGGEPFGDAVETEVARMDPVHGELFPILGAEEGESIVEEEAAVALRDADVARARPELHRYEGGFGSSHSTRCGRRAWANQKFP